MIKYHKQLNFSNLPNGFKVSLTEFNLLLIAICLFLVKSA